MTEPNPMAVIADCIEKSKATADQELIGDPLRVLQTDNTEEDAFNMLCSAIVDAVADDTAHMATATLLAAPTAILAPAVAFAIAMRAIAG